MYEYVMWQPLVNNRLRETSMDVPNTPMHCDVFFPLGWGGGADMWKWLRVIQGHYDDFVLEMMVQKTDGRPRL